MTIYSSSQTNIRGYISENVDPSTDVLVHLSYALTDWCNKVGDTMAVVVTGHEQWETISSLTGTPKISLQLLLRGDGYRNGQSSWSPNILTWEGQNRVGSVQISSGIDGSYDSTDPDDWTLWGRRNSANSFAVNVQDSTLGYGQYIYPTGGVSSDPEVSWAIYSDTPGKEWFSFHNPFDDGGTYGGTFLIRRYNPISTAPTGERDLGWVFLFPGSLHSYKAIYNYNYSDTSQIWKSPSTRSWLQAGAPGSASVNEVSAMQHTLPITNPAGALLGYMDDELLASEGVVNAPYNYRIGTAGTYTAIGPNLLIKTAF